MSNRYATMRTEVHKASIAGEDDLEADRKIQASIATSLIDIAENLEKIKDAIHAARN